MSNLQRTVLKSRLPPIHPGLPAMSRGTARRTKDYTPTPWDKYFERKRDVKISETDIFRVYSSGKSGDGHPIICLLHGGGFSALTWSLFTTFVVKMVHCEVVAIDLRGHGGTRTSNDEDMSAQTLAHDVACVLKAIVDDPETPVLLIGHSMGGAIAVHVGHMELLPNLAGVTVIDVVEGSALEALTSMQSFLRGRPKHFPSLDSAIEWCVRSGQIRNVESAKVSMPGQLKDAITGNEATIDIGLESESSEQLSSPTSSAEGSIQEEDESKPESDQQFRLPSTGPTLTKIPGKYTWRIDLTTTEKYWLGWFQGLSEKFLNLHVPRLLLLAGIERLDKALTVGQMQGKFQMQILNKCGHAVQEDDPEHMAEIIATFLVRHQLAYPASNFERSFPAC